MKKQFLFHMRKSSKIYVDSETGNCSDTCVTMKYVGGSEGEVIWNLINATKQVQYVALVRGATIKYNGNNVEIPPYLFGRAFGEVYFNVGLSTFGDDDNAFETPYTLAVYNDNTIGFVFAIPPSSAIHVPEYGFVDLVSYNAYLLPVKLTTAKLFADIYDYSEVIQYESQTGINLGYLPDPIAFKSIVADAPQDKLGYSFHERILLPIPEQWLETADTVAKFIQKLKSLF